MKNIYKLSIMIVVIVFICLSVFKSDPDISYTHRPFNASEHAAGLPVFPGAEGFGTRTPAGRGGKLIEVINLNNDGPGSLRDALNKKFPRIIVFRVSGIIELKEELYIDSPFVTVAGQTAPGSGICIKNAGIAITSHDVLIQHMRIRPGNEGDVNPENNDAISILGQHDGIDGAYNIVLDHLSISWGEDENVSTWFGPHNITISWSIISEGLNKSRHKKGDHSCGLLIGNGSEHVSVHHNVLAHNHSRNPLINNGGTHHFINNIVYNWGGLPSEVFDTHSNTFVNFIGNHYIAGQSTWTQPHEVTIEHGQPKIFVDDNIAPHCPPEEKNDWALVSLDFGEQGVAPESYRSYEKFEVPLNVDPAHQLLAQVLMDVGASRPERDAVDRRIVSDVKNGTGAVIDSPQEVGAYPKLKSASAPPDSDHDGMPDAWEITNGLNPHNPADGNGDLDKDGYTNVEEYLHFLLLHK